MPAVFERNVIDRIPQGREGFGGNAVFPALLADSGCKIYGYRCQLWRDMGTPENWSRISGSGAGIAPSPALRECRGGSWCTGCGAVSALRCVAD